MALSKIQSESINLADNFAFTGTVSRVGGTNTPAFLANLSSAQAPGDGATTKIQINNEIYDTANAYDNSTNYRFTPQTAGKYLFYASLEMQSGTSGSHNITACYTYFYKNGGEYARFRHDPASDEFATHCSGTITAIMNGSSDYMEVYTYLDTVGGETPYITAGSSSKSFFGGHLIIE